MAPRYCVEWQLEVEHSTTTNVTAAVLLALGAGLIWLGNIFPTLR
jgi:hypothetical protein